MDQFFDMNFKELTYNDYAKDVFNMYGGLIELYEQLFNRYNELCIVLDELDIIGDDDLNQYILSTGKKEYLLSKINELVEMERDIFYENNELLPYLVEHIKKSFHLKDDFNMVSFSPLDAEIYNENARLKGNYPAIRMIRAIKFYSVFNSLYEDNVDLKVNSAYTSDDILGIIPIDYADVECLRTYEKLQENFSLPNDIHLNNKYKCLFMFMNPKTEFILLNTDLEPPFITITYNDEDELQERIKIMLSKTVHTILAIQHNKIINHHKKGRLILDEPDENDFDKVSKYMENKENLYMLYAYALQSYEYYDINNLQDLDHLFTLMCNYNGKDYNDIRLSRRVVNYFFRRDAYNSDNIIERVRKDE